MNLNSPITDVFYAGHHLRIYNRTVTNPQRKIKLINIVHPVKIKSLSLLYFNIVSSTSTNVVVDVLDILIDV